MKCVEHSGGIHRVLMLFYYAVVLLTYIRTYVHTFNVKCEMNDELALIYDLRTPQNKVLKRAFCVCSFCRATATTFPLALPPHFVENVMQWL